MCGIAGVAGLRDAREAGRAVCAMVGALARRGPDGEGVAAWDDVTLGHRRLAIFDLSDAGRQPDAGGKRVEYFGRGRGCGGIE